MSPRGVLMMRGRRLLIQELDPSSALEIGEPQLQGRHCGFILHDQQLDGESPENRR